MDSLARTTSSPARTQPRYSIDPFLSAATTGSARAVGDSLAALYAAGTTGQVLDLRADKAVEMLASLAVAARLCPEHHREVAYLMAGFADHWMFHLDRRPT